METRWLYRTSENFHELREAAMDTCVIPMGCVEKHGLHLPIGTDIIAASHVAYVASQMETFCVFPDFTFGDFPENCPGAPAGTITIKLETQMNLLEEICEQIARHGYKKIIIYNGHGGNRAWLQAFAGRLYNKKRNFVFGKMEVELPLPHAMAKVILEKGESAFPELTKEDVNLILKYHEESMTGGHACMSETAYIMGIEPKSVHLDRLGIESGANLHKADYLLNAGIMLRDGGWGINYPNAYACDPDPIGCNERIGKACIRMEAERVAAAMKLFKEDKNVLTWHEEMQKGW